LVPSLGDALAAAVVSIAATEATIRACVEAGVAESDLKWSLGALEDARSDIEGLMMRYIEGGR
jgi:hypothetical protein